MQVRKRNGDLEAVQLDKITRAITVCCEGLPHVDPLRVATKTISGLYEGASTKELDDLSIQTAASLTSEEPEYSKLAARLLSNTIDKDVVHQNVYSFSQSVELGYSLGLIGERLLAFVRTNTRKLNAAVTQSAPSDFEYFGLRTVYDRYLLRHTGNRSVIENPSYFFLRIACSLSDSPKEALELYSMFSKLEYLPGSPTLFNAGTVREQLSSCYLLDSPDDDIIDLYKTYSDVARLSKFAGGIGLAYHKVRSRGSHIKGTNGFSNGIVPWLKTLDASVVAVNQGGRRKGACCVYLETWHADIEEFLELRDNTGDEARRTHNLNLANWVSDLFMSRVDQDQQWSLFDPKDTPHLPDLYGDEFEAAYVAAEAAGLAKKQLPARELYAKMMRTLAQTGNGWMTFKDKSNKACNQTALPGRTVHLSNLCTEILEVTSNEETAVCNLGSVNLSRHMTLDKKTGAPAFDFRKLAATVRLAIRQLDKVIDINYYPVPEAELSNKKWRPVGLGLMGLQDVFFQLRIPFDSEEARDLSKKISECIYYHALKTSVSLAETLGTHPLFAETRAARGELQFDAWGITPSDAWDWAALREDVKTKGLRNSLLLAIAPTATIATICGCYECIEPQVSNLFKRETLSGDFIQVNKYLVQELKDAGLWNDETKNKLKSDEGSAQGLPLPESVRLIYRTAWEIPMRSLIDMAADRGAFIDQSQSLNLFSENPNIGRLSSMYMYAWKSGVKTTYYLRSRPATRINKVTLDTTVTVPEEVVTDEEAVAAIVCSLENPEACEACQ